MKWQTTTKARSEIVPKAGGIPASDLGFLAFESSRKNCAMAPAGALEIQPACSTGSEFSTIEPKTLTTHTTKNFMPVELLAPDPKHILNQLTSLSQFNSGPQAFAGAKERALQVANMYASNPEGIREVLNSGAVNTVDTALKRTVILQQAVRDFATRVLPLRLLSTVYSDVPLQGTDTITVPYYPLQTAASSNFTDGDGTCGTGYQFGQATTTNKAQITVNKRKYQPIDYSSREFQFQPFFDAARLGAINAEKLGVDILTDILSVVTNANFGAAVKTVNVATMTSDDIADMRAAANLVSWPDIGRSLIVDSTVDQSLMKDSAYKVALNIGTAS